MDPRCGATKIQRVSVWSELFWILVSLFLADPLSLFLSVCLFVSLSLCLAVPLSVCLFVSLSPYPSVFRSLCLFVFRSFGLPLSLFKNVWQMLANEWSLHSLNFFYFLPCDIYIFVENQLWALIFWGGGHHQRSLNFRY